MTAPAHPPEAAARIGPKNSQFKHGYSETRIFKIWGHMISRCHTKTDKDYYRYGAKGITVCKPWRESFLQFLSDMGERPSERHTIDRWPNKNGNYEPGNCRWATYVEQARNRNGCASETHCKHGHEFTPEITKITAEGYRNCRICARISGRRRHWGKKPRALAHPGAEKEKV